MAGSARGQPEKKPPPTPPGLPPPPGEGKPTPPPREAARPPSPPGKRLAPTGVPLIHRSRNRRSKFSQLRKAPTVTLEKILHARAVGKLSLVLLETYNVL